MVVSAGHSRPGKKNKRVALQSKKVSQQKKKPKGLHGRRRRGKVNKTLFGFPAT